ncbi:MAG: Crp/Fnr family transcriptional regulator [Clostridia bacterium]|nr:Crp/Fnr family transcriptional regulator [Clostridia bacterium]
MKARKELFDKAVKLVSEHSAFSGTKEESLRYVLAGEDVLLREVSKGQQVFPCYGVKKAVVLILTGGCHICKDRKIVETKNDGYIFGIETLYLSADCEFSLMAAQDSKIVFIKKPAVDWLLQDDFSAVKSYLGFLSAEINDMSEQNIGLKKASAESKLAGYLLSRPRNSKGEVSLPQDILRLSKQLEIDKNTLFKAIEALNARGVIAFNGSAVCIADEEKLKSFI